MDISWPTEADERSEPDRLTGERQALEDWLEYHRATLISKCRGLSSAQLKTRSAEPSALSLLGLVRHMTEVERWWFRMNAGGEDLSEVHCTPENPEADFNDLDEADAAADIATFHAEVQACREAVANLSLDLVVPSPGDHPERTRNIRWIYLHMIEEYARHNGHADLLRERIDGVTGD